MRGMRRRVPGASGARAPKHAQKRMPMALRGAAP